MKKKESEGWQVLAARTILPRLRALKKELPLLPTSRDIECVHQTRVASRRLRSALGIFDSFLGKKARKWRRQARWITQVLGAARDLDVQIEFVRGYLGTIPRGPLRPGPSTLLNRLEKKRREAQQDLLRALKELEASGLIETMEDQLRRIVKQGRKHHIEDIRPLKSSWARSTVRARIKDMLAYKRYIHDPKHVEELHEMRIAAKRLRYTLEIFAPYHGKEIKMAVRNVKRLQERLGDIHDCDVWVERLPQFLEEAGATLPETPAGRRRRASLTRGIEHLAENRQQERQRLYRSLVRYWDRLESRDTWRKLLKKLKSM